MPQPHDSDTPLLSSLLEENAPLQRRHFLGKSALGLVVGGAALAACNRDPESQSPSESAQGQPGLRPRALQNANSRLDTALHGQQQHGPTTPTVAAEAAPYHTFDARLPPLSRERTLRLHWRAQEVPVRISQDTVVNAWTFEGDIPGPIVHCRVGDTIEFTLTNEGAVPHSMDFHAAQINPKEAFRSVVKGQSVTFTFRPKWAGAFMYHCGSAPVLMHIGAGMYGAIIVSPREPLPPAREFVIIQSEYYLGDGGGGGGPRPFDYTKMLSTMPDFVCFNGRPNQYINDPIRVKVGDRVRFHLVNCGPTHSCAFHVVGEQFDTMYLGSPPESAVRGVQTWNVAPGGGMIFELVCDVAGEFPFVNHGFGHGQKGSIGFLLVEP